ncbi:MAG: TonB family protein [Terriglobales bacterium]
MHKESGGDTPAGPKSGTSLSQIASTLSAAGGGASSTDLALDLVLHEIVEQVRLSTGATGVAVALTRSGELVCRATTGAAPDLGLRLDPYSGLSGLCLRTKSVQRCDDTEMDSRVDCAACRILRVRSILMAPVVLKNGDVVGLLEAFSANPNHFRDQDVEILISFCTRIVNTIESADEAAIYPKAGPAPGIEHIREGTRPLEARIGSAKSRLSDRGTVVLTAAVIIAALVLGWMIGLADRHRVAIRNPVRLTARAQTAKEKIRGLGNLASGTASPAQQAIPSRATTADSSQPKAKPEENPSGGLIVYQNGKVIFREVPRPQIRPRRSNSKPVGAATSPSTIISPAIIPTGKTELLTPEAASQYVISRVQPSYPELARKQRIQGAVLLKVLVGKDGGVQQVQVVSGDPKLAAAAADAVVQWRFKPFLSMGQPAEFQTQVTVNFKLP